MKKNTFILIGMMLTILAIALSSCSQVERQKEIDRNAFENTMQVIESSTTKPVIIQKIGELGETSIGVYDLKYEGKTYLIVGRHNAISIIEHTPKEQIVTMAQPSKQSLESYYNPEKRPVPVGSEKEFIEYHNATCNSTIVDQGLVL
jgi:hypothetical protein